MIANLVQQFMGSGAFGQAVDALQRQHGMDQGQAEGAVRATAEGAADAMRSEGGGGLGGLLGSLGGGGGLGGLLGGGGGQGGLPPQLVDKVASFVSAHAGLDAGMARTVVSVVLPKVLDFVKGGGGKGGGLGGLFR